MRCHGIHRNYYRGSCGEWTAGARENRDIIESPPRPSDGGEVSIKIIERIDLLVLVNSTIQAHAGPRCSRIAGFHENIELRSVSLLNPGYFQRRFSWQRQCALVIAPEGKRFRSCQLGTDG